MVGVCSCVQEKEAIPQKQHQVCTDFQSESIFQLWLKQLSTTSHQILFWQLNFTFGKRLCLCTVESLSCSHRCSQGMQSCRSCTWAVEPSQPQTRALQLQIHTVPPELSRGIQLVLKGSRPSILPRSQKPLHFVW